MTTTPNTDSVNPVHLSAPGSSTAQPYRGKRAFDLLAAGTACLVFGPLAAAISLATVIEDGGPALFFQQRVGSQRRSFEVFKFRSMRNHHVTRVGQWVRRTGLDELPQFMNVWRGDIASSDPAP